MKLTDKQVGERVGLSRQAVQRRRALGESHAQILAAGRLPPIAKTYTRSSYRAYTLNGKPVYIQEIADQAGITRSAAASRIHKHKEKPESIVSTAPKFKGIPSPMNPTIDGRYITQREIQEKSGLSRHHVIKLLKAGYTAEEIIARR